MADVVKTSKMKNSAKGMSKFFKDVRHELKKVIWPNRAQLINNTATVLLACLVIGAVIWASDWVFTSLDKLLGVLK
ncbi:MAG: preprotein translocase subunit SecE [Bacillota bacterium]|nr:preprotein translocase subunit SecE [Bacillota bacterium]